MRSTGGHPSPGAPSSDTATAAAPHPTQTAAASPRATLAATRAVLSGKRDRASASDTAYVVYVSALVAAIVGFPLLRAVAMALSAPEVAAWTMSRITPELIPLGAVLLSAAAFLCARVRGPFVVPVPFVTLVVSSPLPRRLALRRKAVQAGILFTSVALVGAGLLVGAVAFAHPVSSAGTALFLGGVAFAAAQLCVVWMIGQTSSRLRRWTAFGLTLLGAIFAVLLLVPGGPAVAEWVGPWGWLAPLWRAVTAGVDAQSIAAFACLGAGCFTLALWGRVMDSLGRDDLLRQSERWGAVISLVSSGDVRSASARMKALPARGRRWRVRFPAHPLRAVVVRDALGVARFPARAAWWAAATVGVGMLGAVTFSAASPGALMAFVAPLVAYFAVGGWAEGVRFFGFTAGVSSPFGATPRMFAVAHCAVPAICGAVLMSAGTLVGALFVPGVALVPALMWAVAVTGWAAAAQAFAAFRGMLPIALLTPIPTAMGDMSIVAVIMWLSDSVQLTLVVAGSLTLLMVLHPFAGFAALLAATAGVALWAGVRLRRLTRAG